MLADLKARFWAMCGNSRTILVSYLAMILAILEQAQVLDWAVLLGEKSSGKIMAIMGVAMLILRLVTQSAATFRKK